MKKQKFPKQQFNDLLLTQKNIKLNIKPYLDQFTKKNILWIYQSISILYYNFKQPSTKPQIKFNSLLAIQYIIETSQFVPIIFIETYLFPMIKNGAYCDVFYPQNQRGINFFNYSGQQIINADILGNKYVRLCTEIVKILSIIKPKSLYYNEQLQEPSIFKIANEQIQKNLVNKKTSYNFFNQNPQNIKQQWNKNLQLFHQKFSQRYELFIHQKFQQQINNGFNNCILDIRQLIHVYDCYSIDKCLELSAEILSKATQCKTIKLALEYINKVVLSGNYQSAILMKNQHKKIKYIIKQVINIQSNTKSIIRGEKFFPFKNGLPEQKKLLYIELLQSLQLWNNVFTNFSVTNNSKPSMIAKYYKKLKNEYGYEFPQNKNLQNQIEQASQNYKKKSILNERMKVQEQMLEQQQKNNGQNVQIDSDDSIIRGKISSNNQNNNNKSNLSNNNKSNLSNNNKSNQGNKNKSNESNNNKINQNNKYESNQNNHNNNNQNINNSDNHNYNNNYDNNKNAQNKSIVHSNFKMQQSQIMLNDKQAQQYENKKIAIFQSIKNLTTSERMLPKNIKKYEQNYQQLQQFFNEKKIQNNYKQQFNQLQQHHKKINIIYQKYKQNKFSFNNFCNKINQLNNKQSLIQSKNQNLIINIEDSTTNKKFGSNINDTNNQQINHQQKNNQTPSHKKNQIKINQNESNNKSNNKNSIKKTPFSQFSKLQNQQDNQQKQKSSQFILDSQKNKGKKDKSYRQSQNNSAQFILSTQVIKNQQNYQKKKYPRKFIQDLQLEQQSRVRQYQPITNIKNQKIQSNQSLQQSQKSPIKNKQSRNKKQNFDSFNKILSLNDQFIQGPSLNPLNYSYHDETQREQNSNIRNKSFKQIINNDRMMIKTNKKQNLFWLESESICLIRPINNSLKKSKIISRVNVSQLLQQCNKKHQMQIKLLQHNKQIKIKQLENKVNMKQQQLKNIVFQLKSRKQHSQLDSYKQKTIDKYSIIEDQKFVLKKLNKANQQNQQNQNKRKFIQSIKQSKILTIGQLINTKIYQKYLNKIVTQKQKKIHLKNKQLIYKDNDLQIGYMSQLTNQQYKIMLFITPQKKFTLDYINIQNDKNLKIQHNFQPRMEIIAKKQQKVCFFVDVLAVPYEIPQVSISYRLQQTQKKLNFLLPCAFHKFVIIQPQKQQQLLQKFEKNNIIRGQQIPYSRKILKNINLIQDYFPHIQQINKSKTNQFGQYCYGGYSRYKKQYNFYIKICVKPNQFLYIQSIECKNFQCKIIIQFYIATLNHFLMKNITWD